MSFHRNVYTKTPLKKWWRCFNELIMTTFIKIIIKFQVIDTSRPKPKETQSIQTPVTKCTIVAD